jgi:hypothetical protein
VVARDVVTGIYRNVELTRADVKVILDHLAARAIGPANNPADPSGIPLEPQQEDFPNVNWWERGHFLKVRKPINAKDTDIDSPMISMFMEDRSGNSIPVDTKTALRSDLYAYWNDVYETHPNDLRGYTGVGLQRRDHYRQTFEARYPWLRLCNGHWKVDQLWLSYFYTWKRPRSSTGPNAKESTPTGTSADLNAKESTPTSTSANLATSPPPLASKRRLEEDEDSGDDPSKRHKGKGRYIDSKIVSPIGFHHGNISSRKKKAPVKMAKVRSPLFQFYHKPC